jgi:hypothetical protein
MRLVLAMIGARIVLNGTEVRILCDDYAKLDVPRRQGFAWPENARDYAEQLSRERGWPIEGAGWAR